MSKKISENDIRELLHKGQPEEALTLLSFGVGLSPAMVDYFSGAACLALQRVDEAIQYLDRALKVEPDNDYFLHQAGRAYTEAKQFVKALDLYIALFSKPQDRFAGVISDARRALRGCLDELIASPVIEALETLIDHLPQVWRSLPEVRFARAHLALGCCRLGEARTLPESLLQDEPSHRRYRHALAAVALAQGDAAGATAEFREILSKAPDDGDAAQQFARLTRIANGTVWCPALVQRRHFFAVCASLKNEADDILEWMTFHAVVGAQHFYLYLNDCTDNTRSQIARFPDQSMITLHEVNGEFGQRKAYLHAIDAYSPQVEWCAFIDADEFLVPTEEDTLIPVLESQDKASAIVVHWLNFGSNGHETRPAGLCIENFTRRAADDFPDHFVVKSICKMDRIVHYLHPHHCRMLGPIKNTDGAEVYPILGRLPHKTHRAVQLNHYYTKSAEQTERKRARGRPLADNDLGRIRDMSFFRQRDRNEVEDRIALRFVPQISARLAGNS